MAVQILPESPLVLRARVAGLTRRKADPDRIEAARARLRLAVAESYMIRLRDQEDFSSEQRARLAVLLLAPAGGVDATA